jgi:putative hemolysin
MPALIRGRYIAREAEGAADIEAAQRLRHLAFVTARGIAPRPGALDRDAFDERCTHVLLEEARGGRLVACFRLLHLPDAAGIGESYSAQRYDLSRLAGFEGPMAEVGRFCLHPQLGDAEVLRVAWAALTRHVDARGVRLLFGCSSFEGVEADLYTDTFALLAARHLAPRRWGPRAKAPAVFRYARKLRRWTPNLAAAMRMMPPLLRSYLAMGGWVSDHAVVDRDLGTLHVFTGLEIGAIPPARARLLRAVAG